MTRKRTRKAAAKRAKPSAQTSERPRRALVPQPHGGALLPGAGGGPQPGGGRPPDAIRAKLRELGLTKGVPFLNDLLDGKVSVSLLGKCEECGHDQPISEDIVGHFMDRIKANVDQRLKATEHTMKFGLASKELVIASDSAAAFFDCVHRAIVELAGEPMAEAVKARALQLVEAKA